MITLRADSNLLLLSYMPESDPEWITRKFSHNDPITLRGCFHLRREDLRPSSRVQHDARHDSGNEFVFILGELVDEYFRVDPRIVATDNTFHFHKGMALSPRLFVAAQNISILRGIDGLVNEDVYVGGAREAAMPESAYLELIKKFPNAYELTKYAAARVGACLRDYFESATDTERSYQQYLNKRVSPSGSAILAPFLPSELAKYQTLLAKLEDMLANESEYSERNWQSEILDIILLLYPKYMRAFREVVLRDPNGKKRFVDFLLVDFTGNVDLIEIKRPFDNCIVSKSTYRDNYIPMKELSGTVMQLEKYVFYLNKWGQAGERSLSDQLKHGLPEGLQIRIINPKGIIIMGRGDCLSPAQRDDFEIIKRKYHNVIDIVTYDDLLTRLRFTISQWESRGSEA